MVKNILHIGTPILLGIFFYIRKDTDSISGGIAFFSFLACLIWGGLYNKGYFRESEIGLMISYWDKLDKENGTYVKRKEHFFPYKYDAAKCTYILLLYILGWLVFVFFIEKKSSQNTNSENNNTVVDTSFIAPVEVSAQSYQVNYDTINTIQSDTTNLENDINAEDSDESNLVEGEKNDIISNNQSNNINYKSNSNKAVTEDFIGYWENWFGRNGKIKFDLDGKCTITYSKSENYSLSQTSDWYCEGNYLYVKIDGYFKRFEITEKTYNQIKIEYGNNGEFTYIRRL